jgi:predicted transcriptional regulator of viral defense system
MNIQKRQINKRKSDGERFAKLAELGEDIFHADDLANLWGIYNKNTLFTTLSRYLKRGLLFRIYNGLYSVKKVNELDPYFLGFKALHQPAYLSCETVLYNAGILNQIPQEITFVSSISKAFSLIGKRYRSRQMKDVLLFNDTGIVTKGGYRQATLSRAVADMLYFNPKKYFDVGTSKLIDWDEVKAIRKQIYDDTAE